MSTLTSIVTRMLEDHLSDPNGTLFLSARCLRWANDAHREVLRKHRQLRGLRAMTKIEDFSVSAATETYDLSGLTKPFRELRRLWFIPTNGTPVPMEPIPDGNEEQWKQGSGGVTSPDIVPGYFLQSDNEKTYLHVLPLSDGARTLRAHYEFGLADIAGGATLSSPADYDDLVAALGARRAWRSKQQTDEALEAFIASRWLDFDEEFSRGAATSRPARVRDEVDIF